MCKTRLSKGFEQCRRPGPDQGVVAIVEVSRTLGKYIHEHCTLQGAIASLAGLLKPQDTMGEASC